VRVVALQAARSGLALAIGVQLDGAAAAGDSYALASLARDATTVFALSLAVVTVNVPVDGPTLFGEITATATLLTDGVPAVAQTRRRVPLTQLQAGGTIHAIVVADTGLIAVAWEGEAQRPDDPIVTPAPPTAAPGLPATGP